MMAGLGRHDALRLRRSRPEIRGGSEALRPRHTERRAAAPPPPF